MMLLWARSQKPLQRMLKGWSGHDPCYLCTGGHINPAISLAFFLAKKISAQRFLCYVVAQLVGAILGSAFVYAVRVATVHVMMWCFCFVLPENLLCDISESKLALMMINSSIAMRSDAGIRMWHNAAHCVAQCFAHWCVLRCTVLCCVGLWYTSFARACACITETFLLTQLQNQTSAHSLCILAIQETALQVLTDYLHGADWPFRIPCGKGGVKCTSNRAPPKRRVVNGVHPHFSPRLCGICCHRPG